MAGQESRIWKYINNNGGIDSIKPINQQQYIQDKQEITNNILNVSNNFNQAQNLLFSDKNVLFEEGFKSINEIQLCSSIVIRLKQNIENIEHDFLYNTYYNYAKIIRTELDNLFAHEENLATKVIIQSSYPGKKVFNFNNIIYDKYNNSFLSDFDNSDTSLVLNINKLIINDLNAYANTALENYLQLNPTATQFYSVKSFSKTEIVNIPQVGYFYFKFIPDKQIWTVIGAITNLPYFSIVNDNNVAYANFINALNSYLNNWSSNSKNAFDDNITTVIEYKSALSFNSTKCLYSANYPEWTNDFLPNLHKGNEQYDVVSEYTNLINKLWYNYPQLQENDIVITSGFLGEEYYCNIVKIIKYNGVLSFIQQKIDIKPFYPYVTINNDIIVNGSFNVKNSEGVNIIQTDNIKNVISFNDKLGINQEIYNIKGLLDIDNLSNKSVDIIMSDFVQPLLNSYAITELLKDSLTFNGLQDANLASSAYNQYNFSLFHSYILQSIEEGDIKFDHVEGDTSSVFKDFSKKQFTISSFEKIKQIVSELYTMIYLENLPINDDFVLSFVENLSDGYGNFLCSIRALTRYNEIDNTYKIFFFTTYLPIEKYYNNLSYKKELDLLINSYSRVNRFINYSKLVLEQENVRQNLIIGKTNDGTKETFTGFIDNSKYFRSRFNDSSLYLFIRNFPYNQELSILHEKYPYWQNKPGIPNFLPNTDIPAEEVSKLYYNNYVHRFGLFKENYLFPTVYYFSSGVKITFLDTIELNGVKYMLGSGINLSDIVSESIIAKGDNKITGNVSIIDEKTGNNIFNVDTRDKQSYLMYNVGIGTYNPETKLDVKDCGLADAIEIINKISVKFNEINYNITGLKTYISTYGTNNIKYYFDNNFFNPIIDGKKENNKLIQTKDNYYILTEGAYDTNNNFIIDDIIHHYHFIYDNWNGKTVKNIVNSEIQNKPSAKFMLNGITFVNNNNIFYNGSYRISYYQWNNGIKVSIGYVFTIGNKLYVLKTGIDIQNNLTYETNKNIITFLETLATHGNRMQKLVKSIQNPSLIINENVSKININNRLINTPNGRLYKYVLNMNSKENTSIQELDINTYQPISPIRLYTSLNTTEEDFQLRNKMSMLGIKLSDFYSAYWGSGSNYALKPFFVSGNYGIVHCEDDYFDYCATIWLEKIDITSVPGARLLTFYSFELKLPDVLNSSLRVHGDTQLNGDFYIRDASKNENFIFADANNRFLGVNTTQVYGNYSNVYDTTSGVPLSKHSVYIHSHTYPNTAIERNAEKSILLETPEFKADEYTPYFYFKNFSTSTARRQSDYFTFDEMALYGKLCRNKVNTGLPNAFGYDASNVYCYGADRNYEVKDKTGLVKEIGCLALGIEKLDPITDVPSIIGATDARAAFSVNVIDRVPGTMNALERNILYCSNDSNLYANKVTVASGLQFGGHPDKSSDPNKLLWVDNLGRLRFGNQVVNLSNP